MFEIIAIALVSTVVVFPLCLAYARSRSKREQAQMRLGPDVRGETFHGNVPASFRKSLS